MTLLTLLHAIPVRRYVSELQPLFRRYLSEAVTVCLWAVVVYVALWCLGAAAGVVWNGFCAVSGCRP